MGKIQNEPKARVITGIVIAIVVYMVLLLSHIPFVLYSFTALLCIGGVWELHHAVRGKCNDWITYFCLLAAIATACFPIALYPEIISMLFPISFLLFAYLMLQIGKAPKVYTEVLFCISAVVILFYRSIPELRYMEHGFYLLITAVLVGSVTDIGAYVVGKRFGKHKLAPKISPKKTIEGAAGGTLVLFVVSLPISRFCEMAGLFAVNYPLLVKYLLFSSLVGQFGDLAMSAVKRIAGVKDYANFLPGHGGLLDRFDSLLFIAPFTYLFCQFSGSFYS